MLANFDCPCCGKHFKNKRDLALHVHRVRPCNTSVGDVSIASLKEQYPTPPTSVCPHCQRELRLRQCLDDHINNNRCPVLKAQAAPLATVSESQAPSDATNSAPHDVPMPPQVSDVVQRPYDDPDMSFVTSEDLSYINNMRLRSPAERLLLLFKCVFGRPDQPQNYNSLLCSNVNRPKHLKCWSNGAYVQLSSDKAIAAAMRQPIALYWKQLKKDSPPLELSRIPRGHATIVAYLECLARQQRGCTARRRRPTGRKYGMPTKTRPGLA